MKTTIFINNYFDIDIALQSHMYRFLSLYVIFCNSFWKNYYNHKRKFLLFFIIYTSLNLTNAP